MKSQVSGARPRGRSWSDWAGFVACLGLAVWVFRGETQLGVLLIPPVLLELLIAASFLIRSQPRYSITALGPRAAAYAGSFLIPVYAWVSSSWFPEWAGKSSSGALALVGAAAWLFGSVVSLWPVWYLRRSFAIEPAARELVTSGPYRLARHPIYSAYLFMYGGSLLLHPSVPYASVFAVWFALQYTRIRYEERALSTVFPEYAAYRERVGAFGPKLWRSAGRRGSAPVADGPAA